MDEVALQRQYYRDTSHAFDSMHLRGSEHVLACHLLVGFLKSQCPDATILDIGAGTGRLFQFFKDHDLHFSIVGIEPSDAQREIAYKKGIESDRLIDGDATRLQFTENQFDFCTEFGVLHHIKEHERAVREMCRVASKGVFLSDSNNFAQGSFFSRTFKRVLRTLGLWRVAVFVKSKGKGYTYSDGDGVFYSFTVFDCVGIVREKFPHVHIWTTEPSKSNNLFFGAEHVAILAYR